MSPEPAVALVRRWAEDWLEAADPGACDDLLGPDYSLAISGAVLGGPDGGGRDGYVRATVDGLLEPFPGATLAVHELIASGERVAGLMTWRGTTPEGADATWRVVALFRAEGDRLVESHAEEDYLGRRRQLRAGAADEVPPTAADPWEATRSVPPDPSAEDVVRRWLEDGALGGVASGDDGPPSGSAPDDRPLPGRAPDGAGCGVVVLDDGRPGDDPRLSAVRVDVLELFSAGARVAFHAVLHGRYAGGFAGLEAAPPGAEPVALGVAGLVDVAGGAVVGGHVVRDRQGLRRILTQNAKESV